MNIKTLIQENIQDLIDKNLNSDSVKLALKKNPFPEVNYTDIIHQIVSKKKAKEKLPTWFLAEKIIYPEKI